MTVEEAKQILNKRRELVNRIDKLLKRGEVTDPMALFKLQRKRVEGFDLQEAAELLVREADKAFYQQWVEEVLEQPGSCSFQLFQTDIQEKIKLVQQALELREQQAIGSVYVDTPHTMKQIFRYVDEAEWQTAVAQSPYFSESQKERLLSKAAILQDFYACYDRWIAPMRNVSSEIVDVDLYTENAIRILWVLPGDLPRQTKPLPLWLQECATWEDFPVHTTTYTKLFYTSFAIQQLYYYGYDKNELLSFDSINRRGSLEEWYKSPRRCAIVQSTHTSSAELHHLLISLQPNVVLTVGTLPQVWSAIGLSAEQDQLHLLTGLSESCGVATLHRHQGIAFIETPQLTDPSVSVSEFMTDTLTLARLFFIGHRQNNPLPSVVNRVMDPHQYLFEELQKAIEHHRYVRIGYPDPQTLRYAENLFLPLMLKQHAGDWYVIGTWKGKSSFEALYLAHIQSVEELSEEERIPESRLLPYHYAYGVHLRNDLQINPNLTADTPQLFVIRLRVYAPLWQQLQLRPLHFTQSLFPADSDAPYRLFQYKMYLTDELIQLLRGYGRQIEIIEPECLREEV
ncbi:MAG: WYL domain-containing protein [Parabacteroides sp.]